MERNPSPPIGETVGLLDERAEALIIDTLLVSLPTVLFGAALGSALLSGRYAGVAGALTALQFGVPLVFLSYYTGFEAYYGQTLGKRARGIVVVNEDGSPVGLWGAVARNLLRIVDGLPAFYVVGLIVGFFSDDSQRLGDIVGSTVVVKTTE